MFIAYIGFYNDRILVYNDDSVYVYDNPQQFYNFFYYLVPQEIMSYRFYECLVWI